jgi:hypothetical protein
MNLRERAPVTSDKHDYRRQRCSLRGAGPNHAWSGIVTLSGQAVANERRPRVHWDEARDMGFPSVIKLLVSPAKEANPIACAGNIADS